MFKTSSRNKKTVGCFYAVALVFFVLVGFFAIATPQPAYALSFFGYHPADYVGSLISKGWNSTVTQAVGSVTSNIATGLMNVSANLIGWILYIVFYFCVLIISLFISILTYFIGVFLQLNTQVVNSLAVQSGFTITLAVANMGFVLGIIVIAIMTILRSQTYGMKQLLWKFVAAAILVNFSLVIGGVIINFANLFTSYFMAALPGGGAGASGFNTFASALSGAFLPANNPITSQAAMGAGLNGSASQVGSGAAQLIMVVLPVFQILFVLVMCAMVFIVLLTFLFMLLVRYVELSILLILMPLVWLFWVFPKLSHLWDKWWNEFLRWTFFAPIVMFFLYLAIATASAMNGANSSGSVFGNSAGISAIGYVAPTNIPVLSALSSILGSFVNTIIGQALQMLVVVGLVVGGMVAADKLSITGATAAINSMKGETGFGKYLKNRGKKGARAAGDKLGVGRAVQNMRQGKVGAPQFFKRIPLIGAGTDWAIKRGASITGRAVQPYLSNKDLVKEAEQKVPEDIEEIKDNLKGNMSMEDNLAHLSKLIGKDKLTPDTMVGNQKVADFLDQHSDSAESHGWKKESEEADLALGGNKAMRDADKQITRLATAGKSATMAVADLQRETGEFVSKLKKKDMAKMGASGALTENSRANGELLRNIATNASHLIAPALPYMKSAALAKFDAKYTTVLDGEIARVGAGTPAGIHLKGVKTKYKKSFGNNATGFGAGTPAGGGAPAPGP